jgi:hypothetical protein
MIEILALIGLVLAVYWVVRRFAAKPASPATQERSAMERWAEQEALRIVASRIEVSQATLEHAFAGQSETEVVREVEAKVAGIDLAYERAAGAREQVDVRVEVSFEDGHIARGQKRYALAELPESVRDELAQTGASHVYRPWLFPWQR